MTSSAPAPTGRRPEHAQAPTGLPESSSTTRRSDSGNWAAPVTSLDPRTAGGVHEGVRNRRVLGAVQGFGKLWQKTYRVRLDGAPVTPRQVIATWKAHFPEFWPPRRARFYGPITGIAPGEVALLDVHAPGGLKMSTGVLVLYADEESFTFMTPEGHMFAGWITFSAYDDGGTSIAQTQVLIRAQDPIGELTFMLGGHKMEDRFWEETLQALAERFGVTATTTMESVCVDPRRQWRRVGNVRHDIAIRSTWRAATAPVRWIRGRVRRPS